MVRVRVAVIGAGAAGLCAARHLVADPGRFEFKVFERGGEVGGTWCYTDSTDSDEYGVPIHSCMYRSLKTNIPKEIMPFPDFPFHETEASFVHHTDVLKYLKKYVQYYDLNKHIRLRTVVKKVSPMANGKGGTLWSVVVEDAETKKQEAHEFDAVMVCNGHYSVPYVPEIKEIEEFKGLVQHSKVYRSPEPYRNLHVVVLGAAASGMDIAVEVSALAEKEISRKFVTDNEVEIISLVVTTNVGLLQGAIWEPFRKAYFSHLVYISHNLPESLRYLPSNVKQVPGIKSASSEGFTFLDGTTAKADALLYCTGYKFDFPFLTPECKVRIEGRRVMPLYKHLIHTELPTLCFVGLPFKVLPFPLFHFQIQYFMRTLDGSVTLPCKEEMDEETERDFQKRLAMDMPPSYAHSMDSLQWDYFAELADCVGLTSLPPVVRMVYDFVADRRKEDVMHYKTESYTLLDHGHFEKKQVAP